MTIQEAPATAIDGQLGIAPRSENISPWLGHHYVRVALSHAKNELYIFHSCQSLIVRRYPVTI